MNDNVMKDSGPWMQADNLTARLTGSKNEVNLNNMEPSARGVAVSNTVVRESLDSLQPGDVVGTSQWVTVSQEMIDGFGAVTLDPDPMHVDPEWARENGPFGGCIAFGFLTISMLTHLLHSALGSSPDRDPHKNGYYLNYGFDRLRLVSPVRAGSRIRGGFRLASRFKDERERLVTTFDSTIEIEGEARPALIATWLTVWVPPEA